MYYSKLILVLLAGLGTFSVNAFPRDSRVPGGIALIPLKEDLGSADFTFRDKTVLTTHHQGKYWAIVGLPLSLKPGEYSIAGHYAEAKQLFRHYFSVTNKQYTTQEITIKNTRKVNPYAEDMDRILAEKKRKAKAAAVVSSLNPQLDFIQPVQGVMTGSYGRRRVFNGQPRRPHSGMDIAAPTGTEVKVAADGKVIESGDFFFSGNMIYVDHGKGLISLYAHLDEIDVTVGQSVKQGEVIGKVGATGRVTGPHLHWSIGLNGTWIDPALLLPEPQN